MCDDDFYVAIPLADDSADGAAVSGSDEVVYPSDEHHPEGGRGRGEAEFDCARDVVTDCGIRDYFPIFPHFSLFFLTFYRP